MEQYGLTTREKGSALEREDNAIEEARDCKEGKRTATRLAPQASALIEEWSEEADDSTKERQGLKEEGFKKRRKWKTNPEKLLHVDVR
jgi:hypothetical protein